MDIGYTMLCEQTPPKQLVSDLVRAEEIGFGFSVISDHYFPWRHRLRPGAARAACSPADAGRSATPTALACDQRPCRRFTSRQERHFSIGAGR
jgi:hypothetical protein